MASPDNAPRAALQAPVSGEDARAFLQERLAFLGKAYALMGASFHLVGHLVAAATAAHRWGEVVLGPASLIVIGTAALAAATWLSCRRGRVGDAMLLAIDAAFILLVTLLNAFVVFASFPGESQGSRTRARSCS